MTAEERAALIAYLTEQRRHLLAQAVACERLLSIFKGEPCYNKPIPSTETASYSLPSR